MDYNKVIAGCFAFIWVTNWLAYRIKWKAAKKKIELEAHLLHLRMQEIQSKLFDGHAMCPKCGGIGALCAYSWYQPTLDFKGINESKDN